ncbi:MAG: RNA polymerase sigma factor [bacterium]|nr:RNA polymerase sigma factor [bacterium]
MATDPQERDWISSAAAGNSVAFNRLVLAHREGALLLASRLLRNSSDAEDIVQDAFIKAWEELPGFRGDSQFSSWLYRIVYNLSLNKLRNRKLRWFVRIGEESEEDESCLNLPSDDPLPDEIIISHEQRVHLETAIKRLPTKQRSIFVMRHEQGLSNGEIAEITGKSEGSVKANFSFAVAKLREWLEEK